MHNAAAAKSSAVLYTQLSLILHSCAHSAWQYTLNTSQPSMNQQTVSSFHYRPSARVHRLCKRITKYLLNRTMTTRSTCTTPDLPPTFAARLALCKGIHSNKYPPLKSSQTTGSMPLQLLPKQNPYSKTHRFFSRISHYTTLT